MPMSDSVSLLSQAIVRLRQLLRDASNDTTKRHLALAITYTENAILRAEVADDHSLLPT